MLTSANNVQQPNHKTAVHLAQILNNDALQKPNPGADECTHTPK